LFFLQQQTQNAIANKRSSTPAPNTAPITTTAFAPSLDPLSLDEELEVLPFLCDIGGGGERVLVDDLPGDDRAGAWSWPEGDEIGDFDWNGGGGDVVVGVPAIGGVVTGGGGDDDVTGGVLVEGGIDAFGGGGGDVVAAGGAGDTGGGDKIGVGVVAGGVVAELVGGGANVKSGGVGVFALSVGAGGVLTTGEDAVVFCTLEGGVAISWFGRVELWRRELHPLCDYCLASKHPTRYIIIIREQYLNDYQDSIFILFLILLFPSNIYKQIVKKMMTMLKLIICNGA
jgi:hypothetical protein